MKSESIKELATALAKAQGEMTGAKKDSANPFFKSTYADLASVVEAIRVPFAKHGLSYLQRTHESTASEVRVETILMHSSGEWISSGILAVPVTKADAQGYGSALTYCRRYSLGLVGVAPEDDDGNAAAKAAPPPVKKAAKQPANTTVVPAGPKINELQIDELREALGFAGLDEPTFCHQGSLDSLADFQAAKFDQMMTYLKAKADKKAAE